MTNRSLVDEASDPETPFHRLLQLSDGNDAKVRRALVDNPSIAVDESGEVTKEILLKLAEEFPDDVARSPSFALFGLELKEEFLMDVVNVLAENVKDPSILALLLNEFGPDHVDVRRRIASNHSAPPDVLRFLAHKNNEPDEYVRASVARNPNTPEDALRFMADKNNEPEASVRASVSQNRSTPPDALSFLANKNNEPTESVREGVALNLNTPPDVLRFLADKDNEPDWYARLFATNTLKKRGLL